MSRHTKLLDSMLFITSNTTIVKPAMLWSVRFSIGRVLSAEGISVYACRASKPLRNTIFNGADSLALGIILGNGCLLENAERYATPNDRLTNI